MPAVARPAPVNWRPDVIRRRLLAEVDLVAILCLGVAVAFVTGRVTDAALSALLAPMWILLAKLAGLYDADHRSLRHLTVDELPTIFVWTAVATAGTIALLSALAEGLTMTDALSSWAVFFAVAIVLRATARAVWRRSTPRQRLVIIGSGALADAARRKLELFPDIHAQLVDQRASCTPDELRRLPEWLDDVDRIVLAVDPLGEPLLAELLAACRAKKLKLSIVPPARGQLGTAVRLSQVADLPLLEYNTWDVSRSTLLVKRALDVCVSFVLLVAFSPLFAAISLAILTAGGGWPVVFRQRRAGLHGRPFTMVKFRTMIVGAEKLVRLEQLPEPVFKPRHDPRTTRVGFALRRLSIDELPQLWNVLRGEMSLVGPRPEQVELVERYRPEQRFRLSVKPGLTGPMQVFGRAHLTLEERLAVDRDYIENLSLGRDLRILALSVGPLLTGRGAW